MSKKQTAVDWLKEKLYNQYGIDLSGDMEMLNKARQMMREQIEEAWNNAYGGSGHLEASDYFEQNYGE